MIKPVINSKRIFIWSIISTALTLIIFSLLSINTKSSLSRLFLSVAIITYSTTLLCSSICYYLSFYLDGKSIALKFLLYAIAVLFASVTAFIISFYITKLLFGDPTWKFISNYYIQILFSIIIISAAVTTIAIIIENLISVKKSLKINLDTIKDTVEKYNTQNHSLSIKEDEIYHVIKCDDLIYLSAHGKKTTLHTTEKDYETNQLLKNIEKKLSENFIRIHRQFIINIKYLSQVKYFEGGRYLACLADEDESTLPVGRKIAPVLKEKLGM